MEHRTHRQDPRQPCEGRQRPRVTRTERQPDPRCTLALGIVLSVLLLAPGLANAAKDPTPDCGGPAESKCEFKSASHIGKAKKIGCAKGTFFDPIRGGECWSCPKDYIRTGTHIEKEKACAKNLLLGPWKEAKFHRSIWGCDTRKREFLDPIDGGQCYRCPANYNRSIRSVKSDKACTVTAKLTCDSGLEPKGEICFPPVDRAEKARVQKAYPSEEKKYESLHASLAKRLSESKDDPGDQNARRRKLMSDALADVADEDFETVTLLGTFGGSVIVGYGHARGFAMSHGVCREAFGNSFTAGVSAGFSGTEEIGIWKGDLDDLKGETNGIQGSFSLAVLTFTKGIHWSVGAKSPSGITTGTGAGMGLDFGTDYVHGWTKLRCEVDCATLDWDDIPLLDSKASCKQ
jgi:hypothetical protein